jgi:REP element-mobilizing transposase RayT
MKKAKNMRRKFNADGVVHIYQRTISGFNIFYCIEDFIVFYTIVAVYARKFKIIMIGLCQMIDHTHLLASCSSLGQLSRFISAYTSRFVREFNQFTGRKGPLFKKAYGSAVKMESKKIRSAIAYLFNNPVEKKICTAAEDYKWSYLTLYDPERKPIDIAAGCSKNLRRAIKRITGCFNNGNYIGYEFLGKLFNDLNSEEKKTVVEYIMELYFPFAVKETLDYYKSYEDMITAINSNTGSEYEIKEKHYGKTDVPYREIIACLKEMGISDVRSVLTMNIFQKHGLGAHLKKQTSASYTQIRKFLQIPFKDAKDNKDNQH